MSVKKQRLLALVVGFTLCFVATARQSGAHECIGYVSIDKSRDIHLNLFSPDASHVGGAMLLIDKRHPLYKDMKKHFGALKIGHWKCVKSMPESNDEKKYENVPAADLTRQRKNLK